MHFNCILYSLICYNYYYYFRLIDSRKEYNSFEKFSKMDEASETNSISDEAPSRDNAEESSDAENDDDDTKSKMRHNQEQDYSDPDDEVPSEESGMCFFHFTKISLLFFSPEKMKCKKKKMEYVLCISNQAP